MNFTGNLSSNHVMTFLAEVSQIAKELDSDAIGKMADDLASLRDAGGRLFFLGVGGSAGNASHAVNDFRKLCGIESYAPTDNVSELTARTNDEGWETVFAEWLEISKLSEKDALFIFSVGGGDKDRNISANLIHSIDLAKRVKAKVYGVVGRKSGYTFENSDICVFIPVPDNTRITPHAEAFQAVVWHCLVSHPALQIRSTKW